VDFEPNGVQFRLKVTVRALTLDAADQAIVEVSFFASFFDTRYIVCVDLLVFLKCRIMKLCNVHNHHRKFTD